LSVAKSCKASRKKKSQKLLSSSFVLVRFSAPAKLPPLAFSVFPFVHSGNSPRFPIGGRRRGRLEIMLTNKIQAIGGHPIWWVTLLGEAPDGVRFHLKRGFPRRPPGLRHHPLKISCSTRSRCTPPLTSQDRNTRRSWSRGM
jgi:hypothetical protein